jgi:putative membrane protein
MKGTLIGASALAALLLAGSLEGCKSKEQYPANGPDTGASRTAAGSLDTAGTPANPSAAPMDSMGTTSKWSNAAVVGFATVANGGQITLGKLGAQKATNPAVRAFARQMVSDHTTMLGSAKTLAIKLSAMPDTATGASIDVGNHTMDAVKELTDKPRGADWDKSYMDTMVSYHQSFLSNLQDAAKHTSDAQVRSALETATAAVQAHLTEAQAIRSKLE